MPGQLPGGVAAHCRPSLRVVGLHFRVLGGDSFKERTRPRHRELVAPSDETIRLHSPRGGRRSLGRERSLGQSPIRNKPHTSFHLRPFTEGACSGSSYHRLSSSDLTDADALSPHAGDSLLSYNGAGDAWTPTVITLVGFGTGGVCVSTVVPFSSPAVVSAFVLRSAARCGMPRIEPVPTAPVPPIWKTLLGCEPSGPRTQDRRSPDVQQDFTIRRLFPSAEVQSCGARTAGIRYPTVGLTCGDRNACARSICSEPAVSMVATAGCLAAGESAVDLRN